MDDVYENIDNYNSSRKRKTLIVFDGMIADIMTKGRVAWWLATCAWKPKVPGSSLAASYVQR